MPAPASRATKERIPLLLFGPFFRLVLAAEEEDLAASPAAVIPRGDPLGAVEAKTAPADRADVHLQRLAQTTTSLARAPRRTFFFQFELHDGYCIRGASVNSTWHK
jgi:hypothetical protein